MRSLYGDPVGTNLPRDLARLVKRLERTIQAREEPPDPAFLNELLGCVPNLRAFALSLTRNWDSAEDLVQTTLLKACNHRDRFEPGTNLQAWLFTILRNAFHSDYRKYCREIEDGEGSHAATLIYWPDQMPKLDLQDLAAAVAKLRPDQRQALLLVGVEGLSYDDAAGLWACRLERLRAGSTEPATTWPNSWAWAKKTFRVPSTPIRRSC